MLNNLYYDTMLFLIIDNFFAKILKFKQLELKLLKWYINIKEVKGKEKFLSALVEALQLKALSFILIYI